MGSSCSAIVRHIVPICSVSGAIELQMSWCNDFSRAFSSAFKKFFPDEDETNTHP